MLGLSSARSRGRTPSALTSRATSICAYDGVSRKTARRVKACGSVGSNIHPPSGVPGCGESRMAKPGVKIWPLDIVKFCWATAQQNSSGSNAVENKCGIRPSYREGLKCRRGTKIKENEVELIAQGGITTSINFYQSEKETNMLTGVWARSREQQNRDSKGDRSWTEMMRWIIPREASTYIQV